MSNKNDSYDISPKNREIAEWKHQRRMLLREEYLKQFHHPTKYAFVNDPSVQRYNSLKMNYDKFFKPTFVNFLGFAGLIGSITGLSMFITYCKEKEDHLIRTGQVSYADRDLRFW